jgi:hypothetical protein
MMRQMVAFVVAIGVTLASANLGAQAQAPAAVPAAPTTEKAAVKSNVPLRVLIVISRYQGEKKISSVPYTLSVNAGPIPGNRGPGSQLRMGAKVPIPVVQPPKADGKPPVDMTNGGPYTYEQIGTNIDCSANSTADGRFDVNVSISETGVVTDPTLSPATRSSGPVIFRSFQTNSQLTLRDGQTTQFTAATDASNGEIVRIDVTLNLVK